LRRSAATRGEPGFALVLVAFTITLLMGFVGFSIDVGYWYYTAAREQKAADAAALAGVVYLPQPVVAGNSSYDKAVEAAQANGFASGVTVTQVTGDPTQLQAKVTKTVHNIFASMVGFTSTTLSRTAIAEYEAPVAMGSPASVFGTEPVAGSDTAWSNAAFTPNLWGNVYGPGRAKSAGDSVMSNDCDASSQDECGSGTTNLDYNPDGYFYRVNVDASQRPSGAMLAIEVYDPAAVDVGDHCQKSYSGLENAGNVTNDFVPTAAEAAVRYAWGDTSNGGPQGGTWCNGDNGTATTTYVVRQDNNPYQPSTNPVVSTDGCAGEQFGNWASNSSGPNSLGSLLSKASGTYDAHLAQLFRQWVPICVFDPSTQPANDYLVQIRTDIAPTMSQSAMAQEPAPTPYLNDTGGNRFSIRAAWVTAGAGTVWTAASPNANPKRSAGDPYVGGYPVVPRPTLVTGGSGVFGAGLSISATQYMSLYANAASGTTPTYYMARVLPGGSGQTLEIRLWDIGDCSGTGCAPTLTFNYPASYSGGSTPLCTWKVHDGSPGPGTGTARQTLFANQSCTYTVGADGENPNGAWYTIDITIPPAYTCTTSTRTDCWFTMNYHVNGSGNSLSDTTTWGAQLEGSPVRLVK